MSTTNGKVEHKTIKRIEMLLEKFPEVMWDRWSGNLVVFTVFGWIDREQDSYKDYVELYIVNGEPETISTSSAKYSEDFAGRLNFMHDDCQRVEDFFNVPNMMRLEE